MGSEILAYKSIPAESAVWYFGKACFDLLITFMVILFFNF
jgi:hypothetical protein